MSFWVLHKFSICIFLQLTHTNTHKHTHTVQTLSLLSTIKAMYILASVCVCVWVYGCGCVLFPHQPKIHFKRSLQKCRAKFLHKNVTCALVSFWSDPWCYCYFWFYGQPHVIFAKLFPHRVAGKVFRLFAFVNTECQATLVAWPKGQDEIRHTHKWAYKLVH